jgi:catechol 2,3-dioxygenase-like lactoylglutathione lyase family enzyme
MDERPASPTGLRHVALRVRDAARSRAFYGEHFGMRVVWQPDAETAYLSSGGDNLALHQHADARPGGALDHLGFLVAAPEAVAEHAERMRARGVEIVAEPTRHRDGSVSFYCKDPDGNVVQVLWIPEAMR